MSWSFYGVGKSSAVLTKAKNELSKIKCSEPEEAIKNSASNIIEASLLAMPEVSAVTIKASGSQGPAYNNEGKLVEGKFVNTFTMSIEPLYGFIE